MTKELQPTYGNFKLQGVVQGLQRKYAFNDDPTKSGTDRNQLRFSVKTDEDNIVDVEVQGFKFDKVRITPRDRDDKTREDINRGAEIPEGWEVFMGVTTGLEQGEDGKNVLSSHDQYDAARHIYENLKDGDTVFIGGRNEFSQYTNNIGETIINDNLSLNRIYHSSKEFDPTDEEFEEVSAFDQFIVINDVDLDKKEKKAYISSYVIANRFGELQVVPYTFWIDGEKRSKLATNIKKLPFGTVLKVSGKIHSKPIYQSTEPVQEDDGWGDVPTGFEPRNQITGVEKSFEITKGYPNTIEEAKYTAEDLFPPKDEEQSSDNPFADTESDDGWGDNDGDNLDPFA